MGRTDFDPRLESLRGIAALIVAVHHGMTTFVAAGHPFAVVDWGLWLTNPNSSVLFFFVLSGYVLGRSLERDDNYLKFIVRRAFRILPAFVISVLLAYCCVTMIRIESPPPDTTTFFQRPFWPMPTTAQLFDNLLFRSSWINGPTWSIYPEILGSALLPPLVYLHRRLPEKYRWHAFVLIFLSCTIIGSATLRTVAYFFAGYFLPSALAKGFVKDRLAQILLFVAGYALIWKIGSLPNYNYTKAPTMAPAAIAGALLIAATISSRNFLKILETTPLRFLGRVSYSFYLIHWPVFYLTSIWAFSVPSFPHNDMGNMAICAGSIAMALLAASLGYRFVELPFMAAGKKLSARLEERFNRKQAIT